MAVPSVNIQIDKGADVVYQAAGGTGIGVLQAAADAGIMGIGVDTNQNYMQYHNIIQKYYSYKNRNEASTHTTPTNTHTHTRIHTRPLP